MVAVYAVEESNVPDTVGDHDTVPVYCSPEMVVTGTSPNAGGVTPCIDTMTVSGDPLPPPSPPPPQAVNVSERTKRIKNEKFLLFEKMENGKWKMENGKWKISFLILALFVLLCQEKKFHKNFFLLFKILWL